MKIPVLILFTSLALSNYSLKGQEIIPDLQPLIELRNDAEQYRLENNIPAMAVGVSIGGETVWMEVFGYADVEKKVKAQPDHLFPLGSISKSFAATGLMTQINRGLVGLEDDIQPLIVPIKFYNLEKVQPEIRIWQVLSMAAGFNHGWNSYSNSELLPQNQNERDQYWMNNIIVAFDPGETYHYSNYSSGVAQLICEKISGLNYQEFMNKELFNPLDLKNTSVLYDPERPNVKTYNTAGEPIEPGYSMPAGGLGMWSSVKDMLRYGNFHLGNIVKDDIINQKNLALQHQFASGVADLFALGWFKGGNNTLVSNGNVSGANAFIKLIPEHDIVITTLINRTSWDNLADQWADKIEEKLIDKNQDHGYEEWKRIYGTPYVPNFSLLGLWEGQIGTKDHAVSPVKLDFKADSTVSIILEEGEYKLQNEEYNLLRDFNASFRGIVKLAGDEENSYNLHLHRKDRELKGYISYQGFESGESFHKALYFRLNKVMEQDEP